MQQENSADESVGAHLNQTENMSIGEEGQWQMVADKANISQKTASGNIISPIGENQHVIINYYYGIMQEANKIAEQGDNNQSEINIEHNRIKSLEQNLAFEQQTQISFTNAYATNNSTVVPTTEEDIATWFYGLDEYEQHYVFTTAILHSAPAYIISQQAEKLYKKAKEHEINTYSIPSIQSPPETLSRLPQHHNHHIKKLHNCTFTMMRHSKGTMCIYWIDSDEYGYSLFNIRILIFLSKELMNKGSYGNFFLTEAKIWANNRGTEYDYWLAAKALGSILRIQNIQQLRSQADEFAKQSSLVGYRRAASLLVGAYESEQHEQLYDPHSLSTLGIIDRWINKIYNDQNNQPKIKANIPLGSTIAYSYSFIGREAPDIALPKIAELLMRLPVNDEDCANSLSSTCISAYVSLTWSGHLRKVLHNLASIFTKLIDEWTITNNIEEVRYERQQKELCIQSINDSFFLVIAATIRLEGYTTPSETYKQQLPLERIHITQLNYNIFVASIVQNDSLKEAIIMLFRSAIITAHAATAMNFLHNWAETVISIRAHIQDQHAKDIYNTYILFMIQLGQKIQQWEKKQRRLSGHSTAVSNIYLQYLKQWEKEGKVRDSYLEVMASTILHNLSIH